MSRPPARVSTRELAVVGGRRIKTESIAESVYPVRLRLHVSRDGLQERYGKIVGWLNQNCGRGKYWMGPGYRPGFGDALYIYLKSANVAKQFVDEIGCADLVKCEPHPLQPVGCPVYTPDD